MQSLRCASWSWRCFDFGMQLLFMLLVSCHFLPYIFHPRLFLPFLLTHRATLLLSCSSMPPTYMFVFYGRVCCRTCSVYIVLTLFDVFAQFARE